MHMLLMRWSLRHRPISLDIHSVDPSLYLSPPLFAAESFHRHPLEIDLTQACVGELNTILRGNINWPILYGIAVNITTGEIYPAAFSDKGPELPLRQARNFTGGQQVSPQAAESVLSPDVPVNMVMVSFRCWTSTTRSWAWCASAPSTMIRCAA